MIIEAQAIKVLILTFLFFGSGCNSGMSKKKDIEITNNIMLESQGNVKYYKDFDLFSLKGINEVFDQTDYPYVECEVNTDSIKIKAHFEKGMVAKEVYVKDGEYFKTEKVSVSDEGFRTTQTCFLVNREWICYNEELDLVGINPKGMKRYVSMFSVYSQKKRETYVFNRPEKGQKKINISIEPRIPVFDVKRSCERMVKTFYHIDSNEILIVDSEYIEVSDHSSTIERGCYDLSDQNTFFWFHFFGNKMKVECKR